MNTLILIFVLVGSLGPFTPRPKVPPPDNCTYYKDGGFICGSGGSGPV